VALSTTYLPARLAAVMVPDQDSRAGPAAALNPVPSPRAPGGLAASPERCTWKSSRLPAGLRFLRLSPAEPAITVTVRLDDPAIGTPVALTTAILHPARFKIAVETPAGQPGSQPGVRWRQARTSPMAAAVPGTPAMLDIAPGTPGSGDLRA
jgi:hypothetical protein